MITEETIKSLENVYGNLMSWQKDYLLGEIPDLDRIPSGFGRKFTMAIKLCLTDGEPIRIILNSEDSKPLLKHYLKNDYYLFSECETFFYTVQDVYNTLKSRGFLVRTIKFHRKGYKD